MFSPVDRFRVDLTTVVRRLSRAQANETAIVEMVSHFDGLFKEECETEPNVKLAEKSARKRMGSLYKIAFQIVNTPDRTRKGLQLQASMFIMLGVLTMAYAYATTRMDIIFFNEWLPSIVKLLMALLLIGGIIAGFGISLSKSFAWKPLLIAIAGAFVACGQIMNNSAPVFQMTRKQIDDIVVRQSAVETKAVKIETQVKAILSLRNQPTEVWKRELSTLAVLTKGNEVDFFKVDKASSGAYLYPTELTYPNDQIHYYSLRLVRTNDLALAQGSWRNDAAPGALMLSNFQSRNDNLIAWKDMAANQPMLWVRGYKLSGMLCLASTIICLLLALCGFAIGQIRVFGFDWLRGARA